MLKFSRINTDTVLMLCTLVPVHSQVRNPELSKPRDRKGVWKLNHETFSLKGKNINHGLKISEAKLMGPKTILR